jgi:15-cis-phytoene synthase
MTSPADEGFDYCEALVRAQDKDRFLASLFAPAARRNYLFALYAFNLEVARIGALVREPMAGAIRLQWWREALSGERPGEAAASPVAASLNVALAAATVDRAPLLDLIELRRAELFGEPAISVEPNIFLVAARLLGGVGEELQAIAEDAGLAYDWSHDPTHHAAARQHYVRFLRAVTELPKSVVPAFLPVALVPLRFTNPDPPQWRRQIALARTVWFGFP